MNVVPVWELSFDWMLEMWLSVLWFLFVIILLTCQHHRTAHIFQQCLLPLIGTWCLHPSLTLQKQEALLIGRGLLKRQLTVSCSYCYKSHYLHSEVPVFHFWQKCRIEYANPSLLGILYFKYFNQMSKRQENVLPLKISCLIVLEGTLRWAQVIIIFYFPLKSTNWWGLHAIISLDTESNLTREVLFCSKPDDFVLLAAFLRYNCYIKKPHILMYKF